MPVSTRQALFAARMAEWQRCRDAVAGADAVKARGADYLPRLGGQGFITQEAPGIASWPVDEYESYKMRANWFNASKAAVKEMRGALFRVPVQVEVPDPVKAHLDDITMTGESFQSFAQRVADEVITVGFNGVLVDLPTDTLAPHPYWIGYPAEQILRVLPINRDGVWVLGQVVLEETTLEAGVDEFDDVEVTRWRVLQLDDAGYLVVRRFVQETGGREPVEVDMTEPTVRGRRIQGIPFITIGSNSLRPVPEPAPILDLVDINYSHYRTSADLEEALHKLAVPTPYASGVDDIGEKLRLGANVAYTSTNASFKIAYAEFSGAGLGELRTALEHKEAQMDAIRSRLLSQQKGGVESAEAIRLRTAGEQNVLMTLSQTLSSGFERLFGFHCQWMGIQNPSILVKVNDDFVDNTLSPQEMAENRADYQAHLISYSTWHWRSVRGELMRPDITPEEEMAEIEAEQPLAGEIDLPADDTESPATGEAA